MIKTCPHCRNDFKTYHSTAIFCGKACHSASMTDRPTFVCANCENEFQRPRHVIKKETKLKFCGATCHVEYRRKNAQPNIPCEICGTMFDQKGHPAVRHCSFKCRNASLVTALQLTCDHCKKAYRAFASEKKRGRKFCSHECAERATVGAAHPNWRGGRDLKFGTHWSRVRLAVLDRDKVCRLCGGLSKGRSLDVHHINGRRTFLLRDAADDARNLVALCRSCHLKVEAAITHDRTAALPKWLRPRP